MTLTAEMQCFPIIGQQRIIGWMSYGMVMGVALPVHVVHSVSTLAKTFSFVEYLHTNNIKCFENVWCPFVMKFSKYK